MLVATALLVAACSASGGSTSGPTTTAPLAPGSHWSGVFTPVDVPAPVNGLTAVSCASATVCWAVGATAGAGGGADAAAIITTNDGGATWTAQTVPSSVGSLSGVACSDRLTCVAVGQAAEPPSGAGAIVTTTDGGATWITEPVPTTALAVTAVTCLPSGRCTAMATTASGTTALVATAPFASWSTAGPLPPGVSDADSVDCIDTSNCWATGESPSTAGHVTGTVLGSTDGGATWVTLPVPTGAGQLDGVSCVQGPVDQAGQPPSSSTTAAATGAAPATTTTSTSAVPTPGVAGVRCAVVGTTEPVADDTRSGAGVIDTTDNGGATWTTEPTPPSVAALFGVSCPALGACVAVGTTVASVPAAGAVIATGDPDDPWSRPGTVRFPQSLDAVSCVSESACVAVGEALIAHLGVGGAA